jgi:hypothetical protein
VNLVANTTTFPNKRIIIAMVGTKENGSSTHDDIEKVKFAFHFAVIILCG